MRLSELLFTQGFGTRRVCAGLREKGHVALADGLCTEAAAGVDLAGPPLAFPG